MQSCVIVWIVQLNVLLPHTPYIPYILKYDMLCADFMPYLRHIKDWVPEIMNVKTERNVTTPNWFQFRWTFKAIQFGWTLYGPTV